MAHKLMKKLKEEMEKKSLKLSVNENGKERKSKMIESCGFLEEELRQTWKLWKSIWEQEQKNQGGKEKANKEE